VLNLGLVSPADQGKEHLNAMPHCTRPRFVAVCDSNQALRAEVPAAHPSLRAYATVEELARGGALILTAIQRHHPSYVRLGELLTEIRHQGARVHGLEASLSLGFPPGRSCAQGWRGAFDSAGGGVLLDAFHHLVDLAHFLLGSLDLLAASSGALAEVCCRAADVAGAPGPDTPAPALLRAAHGLLELDAALLPVGNLDRRRVENYRAVCLGRIGAHRLTPGSARGALRARGPR
jgi:predicted dehydrogenase